MQRGCCTMHRRGFVDDAPVTVSRVVEMQSEGGVAPAAEDRRSKNRRQRTSYFRRSPTSRRCRCLNGGNSTKNYSCRFKAHRGYLVPTHHGAAPAAAASLRSFSAPIRKVS